MSNAPKLVVFGASGYVGSTVARIATEAGITVVGASSSGRQPVPSRNAPADSLKWVDAVQWSKVDALQRRDVADFLDYHEDASAVISTIGLLTLDHKNARRVNGDANVNIAATVFDRPRIRRFVYVSAAVMRPADRVLHGYYYGKNLAERAIGETLGGRGAILRPGMVSGTRVVTSGRFSNVPLNLALVGSPMETVFRPLWNATGLSLLTPPTPVERLARAALFAALQQPCGGDQTAVAEYQEMVDWASHLDLCQRLEASGATDSQQD